MALLTSELDLIRYELGWSNLTTGAEPYIGIAAIFDRVVAPYLRSGLITTSSTSVVASDPAPKTIVLAAVSGTNTQGDTVSVHPGDRLVVDVDDRQESASIESVSGSSVTLLLSLDHSGTYPVTVEGGEAILRDILRRCRKATRIIEDAMDDAGIKKVDEVEFFPSKATGGSTVFQDAITFRQYWRGELYRLLFGVGDRSLSGQGGGSGGNISIY